MQMTSPEYMLALWKRQGDRQESYIQRAVYLLELPERS